MNKTQSVFLITVFLIHVVLRAQEIPNDSIVLESHTNDVKFSYKHLIIPTVLIGYGAWGLKSDALIGYNTGLHNELNERTRNPTSIDDFSRYAPVLPFTDSMPPESRENTISSIGQRSC